VEPENALFYRNAEQSCNLEDRKGSAKFAKKDFARISSKMGFSLRSSRPFFASFAVKSL
jgi:hypothetical protein